MHSCIICISANPPTKSPDQHYLPRSMTFFAPPLWSMVMSCFGMLPHPPPHSLLLFIINGNICYSLYHLMNVILRNSNFSTAKMLKMDNDLHDIPVFPFYIPPGTSVDRVWPRLDIILDQSFVRRNKSISKSSYLFIHYLLLYAFLYSYILLFVCSFFLFLLVYGRDIFCRQAGYFVCAGFSYTVSAK